MVKELELPCEYLQVANRYLSTEEKCILCEDDRGKYPSKEHVFAECAIKKHKPLSGYESACFNIVKVCSNHHKIIDLGKIRGRKGDGKIAIYNRDGIMGLIKFIAAYPRTPILELKDIQHQQWITLFEETKTRFKKANGSTPQTLLDTYRNTVDVLESYLVIWRDKGDFVEYLPESKRFISIP